MSISRYTGLRKIKSSTKKMFLEKFKLNTIPERNTDLWIRWRESDTAPLMANRFYGEPQYYWVILIANNVSIESDLVAGQKIRIPKNINTILSQL